MNELDTETLAARYRLGPADARLSIVSTVREGAPTLVGLGVLVQNTRVFTTRSRGRFSIRAHAIPSRRAR